LELQFFGRDFKLAAVDLEPGGIDLEPAGADVVPAGEDLQSRSSETRVYIVIFKVIK
jgi:hypothetical protein